MLFAVLRIRWIRKILASWIWIQIRIKIKWILSTGYLPHLNLQKSLSSTLFLENLLILGYNGHKQAGYFGPCST